MLSLSVRPREARLVGNLTPLVASMSAARWDRAPEGLEARPGIGWRRAIQSKDHEELDICVGAPLGTRRTQLHPDWRMIARVRLTPYRSWHPTSAALRTPR
jgi:hypothetical protein